MDIFQLLRVKPPENQPWGRCVTSMQMPDRLIGREEDGSPIIEKGDRFESWGYASDYARLRRRLIRAWFRLRRVDSRP